MSHSSIIVFGEALVDLFKDAAVVGGAPFNVARHLAGFGQSPLLITAIGQDNAADLILQEVNRYQLSTSGIQVLTDKKTGIVEVHENANGHEFVIMPDCAYDEIETTAALTSFTNTIRAKNQVTMLYHGTLGLRSNTSFQTFQAICQALKNDVSANIYLDINWRDGHVSQEIAMNAMCEASVIKVSVDELQMVLTWFNVLIGCKNKLPHSGELERPIQSLMKKLKAHLLLVTYGDLGSVAFNRAGVCLASVAASQCESLVDTVGAGDAFSSVMLLAIINNWPIDLALQRANQFASDICGIRGATPNDLTFYKKYALAWKD